MQKNYLLFSIFLLSFLLPVQAMPDYNELRELMIKADTPSVVKLVEQEKLQHISKKEAVLYAQALVSLGEFDKVEDFLLQAIKRYKKNQEFRTLLSELSLFKAEREFLSPEHQVYIKLLGLLAEYILELNAFNQQNLEVFVDYEALPQKLKEKRNKIIQGYRQVPSVPYLPNPLQILLDLRDYQALNLASKEALLVIQEKQDMLFPKSMDFYDLAFAYKTLAVAAIAERDMPKASRFAKLAKHNIYKMRSLWLVEDFVIYKKVMKTTKYQTEFAVVFPQWLMKLRQEFESYFLPRR